MPRRLCLAVFIVWTLVAAIPRVAEGQASPAQGGAGTIEGRVSDSQQLPLPGTTIEVQDAQQKTLKLLLGQDDGRYVVSDLPPGTYAVQFSHEGFQTNRKEGIVVVGGATVPLDTVLVPQRVTTNLTVTAQQGDYSVASKTDIPTVQLPVTVDTVPSELIRQQASTDIVPVINNLPAANAWTQYGSLNYFEFRGMVMDQDPGSAVLLNGLPILGNRSDSQINSVESVDVLKGPASMLYGTQDPGGTINIVEKQPQATRQQEIVLHGGQWATGGIEFGSTGPLGSSTNLLYRVDIGYLHSDGFRQAGYDKLNLSPKLFWRMTPRDRLRFNVSYNHDNYDLDAGIPLLPLPNNAFSIPAVNINNRYNSPGNFEHLNLPVVQMFYEHDFSDNLRFRAAGQYQYISDEYWEAEGNAIDTGTIPFQVLRGPSANPSTFSLFFFHHDQVALAQTDLVGSFHLLWKHQFMVGYEFDRQYHKTERSTGAENVPIPPISLFNPVETAAATTDFPASSFDGLRNLQNAVYFQDFIHIHPKLQVLLGGRYDAYRHYDFNYPVVNGVWQYAGPQDIFAQNPFTYRVGVISPILPFLSLYANWASSFTAQTELSTAGNPLVPETGRQFEAGGRTNFFRNRISLNIAYFHLREDNITESRADGVIDQANALTSRGAEVELRARASQKLNVFASYGYTLATFNNFVVPGFFNSSVDVNLQGFVPALIPKTTERVWVNYELPKGFNVSLGQRYVSRRPTDFFNIFWMPGYTTLDAAIVYRRAHMEYGLNVTNLADNKSYFISAIDDTQVYPGPPINVTATMRFRF